MSEPVKLCRSCAGPVRQFMDLGMQPASNALLSTCYGSEKLWPLKAGFCEECELIQTMTDILPAELFTNEYPYFSGQSAHWVKHCAEYVNMITKRLGLSKDSVVIEIGGNDGTLLKNFGFWAAGDQFVGQVARAINIEPSKSVAEASAANGVETWQQYWSVERQKSALQVPQADLIIANNVMAHTPDLNGFAQALWETLKPGGTATIEFPWALNMLNETQFDTIYHEHYSYLSLTALIHLFQRHKLQIYDVESLLTHGGSLRAYVHRTDVACPRVTEKVNRAVNKERGNKDYLEVFEARAKNIRNAFWDFCGENSFREIYGYGAAAKGNTFLNYCKIDSGDIQFVGDTTPAKIGKFLPGTRIEIVSEETLLKMKPERVLILPWNWSEEIRERLGVIRKWGGKFVTAPYFKV
jgi:SAM-dependent methyltransferase